MTTTSTLALNLNVAPLVRDLGLLAEAAQGSLEIRQRFLAQLADGYRELLPASGAGEV